MIRESIITTRNADGSAHIAPMGVHVRASDLIILPFKPSTTLDNLLREDCAAVNYTDDVRVYAGCLTGRRDWPVCGTTEIDGLRLADCLAHNEVRVAKIQKDDVRPEFTCQIVHEATHKPFHGFNRAQAAVIEAAILVSRLHMLPADKIDNDIDYLRIAIDKTAGERERQAWNWLMTSVSDFRNTSDGRQQA